MTPPPSKPPLPLWKRHAKAAISSLKSYRRKLAIGAHGVLPARPELPSDLARSISTPIAIDVPWAHWLGHATVLLELAGIRILTDPVFAHRIGMELGSRVIGVRRHAPLVMPPQGLPPLDFILISHAHFDHLDRPTLRSLASPRTTVITARSTADLIPSGFANVRELAWREHLRLPVRGAILEIEAVRPEHWGARRAIDGHRGFNSYVLTASAPEQPVRRVLFGGDTGDTDAFDGLAKNGPPIDLAILGIGSYEPWEHMHATPEQAWSMFQRMRALRLMPVHHSTFPLGHEPIDEPMSRLLLAAGEDVPKFWGSN